jgi:hypothetical protein
MTAQKSPGSSQSASETARPGTPAIVDVFAKTNPDGTVKFTHEWRWGEKGPSQGNGKIIVPARRSSDPETPMHFHLRDNTDPKRGLEFHNYRGAAMWVRRDCCPPALPRCDDPQIPPSEMTAERHLLKVTNINSEECTLHYRLWFQGDDGKLESYDPEIINGGKNRF